MLDPLVEKLSRQIKYLHKTRKTVSGALRSCSCVPVMHHACLSRLSSATIHVTKLIPLSIILSTKYVVNTISPVFAIVSERLFDM